MLPPPLPPQGISLASAPHLYSLLLRAIACYCCRNCGRAEFAAAGCLCQALLPMCPLQGREDGRIAVPANSGCCAVEGWKHVQGRHVWIARACQGDDFGWMAGRQAGRQAGVCVYKDGRQPHAAMAAAWFGQHKEGGELLEGSTGNGGKENMTHRGGGGGLRDVHSKLQGRYGYGWEGGHVVAMCNRRRAGSGPAPARNVPTQ